MKVIEVQPTPNPNAMKFVVEGLLSEQPVSFFNPAAGQGHPLAARIFEIAGVASLLILKDFVTVNKTPEAQWRTITPAVKKVLAGVE